MGGRDCPRDRERERERERENILHLYETVINCIAKTVFSCPSFLDALLGLPSLADSQRWQIL